MTKLCAITVNVHGMQEHGEWLTHVADLLADRLEQLLGAYALSNEGAKNFVKVLGVHSRYSGSPDAAEVHNVQVNCADMPC